MKLSKHTDVLLSKYNDLVNQGKIESNQLQINLLASLSAIDEKRHFWRMNNKKGAYLYGEVGRGKSMIMDLFYENSLITKKRRVHFNEFMQEIHKFLHEMSKLKNPIQVFAKKICKNYSLLCLDEMQVYDIGDAMILQSLFSIFFSSDLILVITSNYSPDHLYENGLQRELFFPTISLISEKLEIMCLGGLKDYRVSFSASDVDNFFFGEEGFSKLRLLFKSMTQNARTEEYVLHVYDRELIVNYVAIAPIFNEFNHHKSNCDSKIADVSFQEIENSSEGFKLSDIESKLEIKKMNSKIGFEREKVFIAWFDFDDLCSANLWVADYEAIAKNFYVIFISNIPKFDISNSDAMRRFTMLIDSLYEHKNVLFCSIKENSLDALFRENPPVDFQRTVSRLSEMRSTAFCVV